MYIERLVRRQQFIYEGRKFRCHSVVEAFGRVWIETMDGTLLCERYGAFVEV
jgi:hypothetical protein